jgi:hypothetical protein
VSCAFMLICAARCSANNSAQLCLLSANSRTTHATLYKLKYAIKRCGCALCGGCVLCSCREREEHLVNLSAYKKNLL